MQKHASFHSGNSFYTEWSARNLFQAAIWVKCAMCKIGDAINNMHEII
jgi:hypothetical protein